MQGVTAVIRRMTQRSSSNFKFAFLFLGQDRAEGLGQVYEFCRVVDDIVDEREPGPQGDEKARRQLAQWSDEIGRIYARPLDAAVPGPDEADEPDEAGPRTELGRGLACTRAQFDYPKEAFDEIIAGVAMDLDRDRYETLEDLRLYCYRVASCVGFLCIALFGDQSEDARRYAEHLGLALQYTNILRDVAEDAMRGRIYIPQEFLHRHGLSDRDIVQQRYDDRFVAMAAEFADAAEREYRRAWYALPKTDTRAMLPAEIMGRTYYKILGEIRARDYNVFTRRAALRRRDKLKVAAMAIARNGLSW